MSIFVGSEVVFAANFVNGAGTDTDPDSVRFFLREGVDATELEWIYNASPTEGTHYPTGMEPIVRNSTGNFSLPWLMRKPERHTGFWVGSGTVDQAIPVTVFVRHTPIAALDP